MRNLALCLVLFAATAHADAVKPDAGDADAKAIRQAALDYIEGWYEGNADRMARALHPELAKRVVITENGFSRIDSMGATKLVAFTRNGGGQKTPKDKQLKEVTILDRYQNAASVKVVAADFVDYLHIGKTDGKWRIINVLWELKPKQQ